jgi:hypothetical protein
MLEIQGIGFPFFPEFSSCGKRKPKLFRWTREQRDIQIYIDRGIYDGLLSKKHNNKYGWFLKSRGVLSELHQHVVDNLPCYKNSYKAMFTCDDQLVALDPCFFLKSLPASNTPWTIESECKIYPKSKRMSMICSTVNMTPGHVRRLKWAEKLKDKLELFGGACGSRQIGVKSGEFYHHASKLDGLKDYMFSVVIENSCYSDYFTEKITDCFATGTIPIYIGNPSIGRHFNMDGIILLNKETDLSILNYDIYRERMHAIADNLDRVVKMDICEDGFVKDYLR